MNENELSKIALDVAFNIHKELGPGLFESVCFKNGIERIVNNL
jgi:hypothetical protein